MLRRKRRTLSHAPHPNMTLKSAVPGVKATSRSSTARPQKKEESYPRCRHCEERSDEAIQSLVAMDCFASLAMMGWTAPERHRCARLAMSIRPDEGSRPWVRLA